MNALMATDLQSYLRHLIDENIPARSDGRSTEIQDGVSGAGQSDRSDPCPRGKGERD